MLLLSKKRKEKKRINITSLYFRLGFFNVILKGCYVEKNTAFKIYEVQKGNKVHWVEISILTKDYSPITTKDRHDELVEKLGQEKKWSVGNVDDEGVKGSEMRQESTMLLICFCREKQINARGNRHFWMFSVRVQVEDNDKGVCVGKLIQSFMGPVCLALEQRQIQSGTWSELLIPQHRSSWL